MHDKQTVEAMVAPCDLWVLPTPRTSRWFTHLDWYLNWQMCKGLAYAGLHLPAETYRIAEEYGVPLSADRAPGATAAPLLISAEGRVPARRCLVIESTAGLSPWLKQVRANAAKLRVQSVRVFLPSGVSVEQARKHWQTSEFDTQFSPDLESTT